MSRKKTPTKVLVGLTILWIAVVAVTIKLLSVGKTRNILYFTSRRLGDVNAVRRNKIPQRIAAHVAGKITGRVLGKILPR